MPRIRLDETERLWIKKKWAEVRKSEIVADRMSAEWSILSTALDMKMNEEGIVDAFARDQIKEANIELRGYYAAGNWHRDNAIRHMTSIQTFLKMRELEVL